MYKLTIKSATNYVKKVLDELDSSEDTGMLFSHDDLNLRKLVEGFIVEAVIGIHSKAKSYWVDGVKAKQDEDYNIEVSGDVVEIKMLKPTLRIVSVKMGDSDKVVTELLTEDSPEGRMQLNPFIKGRYDSPKVVLQKEWSADHLPIIRYYSLRIEDEVPPMSMEYIPYPEIYEQFVLISARLEQPTLDMLVSLILESYSEHEKAEIYKQKAQEYIV